MPYATPQGPRKTTTIWDAHGAPHRDSGCYPSGGPHLRSHWRQPADPAEPSNTPLDYYCYSRSLIRFPWGGWPSWKVERWCWRVVFPRARWRPTRSDGNWRWRAFPARSTRDWVCWCPRCRWCVNAATRGTSRMARRTGTWKRRAFWTRMSLCFYRPPEPYRISVEKSTKSQSKFPEKRILCNTLMSSVLIA